MQKNSKSAILNGVTTIGNFFIAGRFYTIIGVKTTLCFFFVYYKKILHFYGVKKFNLNLKPITVNAAHLLSKLD